MCIYTIKQVEFIGESTFTSGEEDQTTEHVLQRCNRYQPERIAQWPSATPLHQKLYRGLGGPEEDHQLHHCCWTGRVGEREEEEEEEEEEERSLVLEYSSENVKYVCL